MKIEYLCPTLYRGEKVARFEASVDSDYYIQREIVPRALPIIYQDILKGSDADVCVLMADHLVIQEGCRDAIEAAFEEHFPDFDGVVGLTVENMPVKVLEGIHRGQYAHPAIGRKFIERFPDRQCHCPDYYHFYQDTELGLFAESLSKFYYSAEAKVFSYHPNAKNAKPDVTHAFSRQNNRMDRAVWLKRQELGLLWGDSFEQISTGRKNVL